MKAVSRYTFLVIVVLLSCENYSVDSEVTVNVCHHEPGSDNNDGLGRLSESGPKPGNSGQHKYLSDGQHFFRLDWKVNQPLKCIESGTETHDMLITVHMNIENSTGLKDGATILLREPNSNVLTSDGKLKIDDNYNDVDEYCIHRLHEGSIEIRSCAPNCDGKDTICIRKCCSIGKSIELSRDAGGPSECLETETGSDANGTQWAPVIYSNPHTKSTSNKKLHYVRTSPNCSGDLHFLWGMKDFPEFGIDKEVWRILEDGSITYLSRQRRWTKLPSDDFCIDAVVYEGDTHYSSGKESDQIMILCIYGPETEKSVSYIYVTVMLFASVFLLTTAIVYIILWDQQTIHGWTVFSLVTSMFFMYIFLTTGHLLGQINTSDDSGSAACVVVAIVTHFFVLSTFCWMSLINFDLFCTFRSMKPQGSGKSKGLRKFILYLALAWSVPLIVIVTGLILTKQYPDIESEVTLPGYGDISCFLSNTSLGPYLYYIIVVLLFANVILTAITISKVYKLQQNAKIVAENRKMSHQSLKLFAKLFIVMGVTWIFEFITWLVDKDRFVWYWIIPDMLNACQAVAVFIIFVCKPRIWMQLRTKYALCRTFQKIGRQRQVCLERPKKSVGTPKFNSEKLEDPSQRSLELEEQQRQEHVDEHGQITSLSRSRSSEFTDLSRSSSVAKL